MTTGALTITLDDGERQVLLLALAVLGLHRPGWQPACIEPLAARLDGRARDNTAE